MKFEELKLIEKIEVKRYIKDLMELITEDTVEETFNDLMELTKIDRKDLAVLFNKELAEVYDDLEIDIDDPIPEDAKIFKSLDKLLEIFKVNQDYGIIDIHINKEEQYIIQYYNAFNRDVYDYTVLKDGRAYFVRRGN